MFLNHNFCGPKSLHIPVQSMSEGDVLWVVRDATAYADYFGPDIWSTITYTEVPEDQSGGVNQNGDDAVELFFNGEAFDVYHHLYITPSLKLTAF